VRGGYCYSSTWGFKCWPSRSHFLIDTRDQDGGAKAFHCARLYTLRDLKKQPGLRFDKVATRVVERLRATADDIVPSGTTVVMSKLR